MPAGKRDEAEQDELFQYARDVVRCGSRMMSHLPIRGLLLLSSYWPPGLAWMTILHDMKMRPEKDHVQDMWNELSEDRAARQDYHQSMGLVDRSIGSLSHVILKTWRANEAFAQSQGQKLQAPPMIAELEKSAVEESTHGHSKQQPPTHPGNIASVDENMTAQYVTYSFGMNGLTPETKLADTESFGPGSQPLANAGFRDDPLMNPSNRRLWGIDENLESLAPWS
ncbi:hypothetical protein PG988_015911 [Apiospora saccharicola]